MFERDSFGLIHRFDHDPISDALRDMRGAGMSKTNAPGPFRPAGAGSLLTFKCTKCARAMTTGGSKKTMRGGLTLPALANPTPNVRIEPVTPAV